MSLAHPIHKDYISIKINLDNYDGLMDSREYVQNVRSNLELVIQNNDVMCKILLMIFRRSAQAWYNNLESGSIMSFKDLYVKLFS
jgi:hypothetical protein